MSITRIVERLDEGSADHTQRLFDAALDAVIAMDGAGYIIAWNKAAETCFGWTRQEALGRQLSETVIPAGFRTAHHAGLERYHQSGTGPVINSRVEVRALRRDGTEFPVELTVVPLRSDEGEVFYAFLRDITDRTRAEKIARQRAIEAQLLFEATSLITQGGSADELFKQCLRMICELTGWNIGHVLRPEPPEAPEHLIPTDTWHCGAEGLEAIRTSTQAYTFRPGEGLPGRVWASGEPAWIENLELDADFIRRDLYIANGLRSAFAFPVFQEGRLRAVLEFFSSHTQKPDEVILLVARSLAVQLGPVLDRLRALEQREILLRELDHRVGNLFTVILSIFRRTARHAETMEELTEKFEGRLESLLRGHQLLTGGGGTTTLLREILTSAGQPYGADARSSPFRLDGPDVRLPAQTATQLSMVFHELATNAAKHGAVSIAGGEVIACWSLDRDRTPPHLRVEWREVGGPPPRDTGRQGYGSVLIEGLVTRSLDGSLELRFDPPGFSCVIEMPLESAQ